MKQNAKLLLQLLEEKRLEDTANGKNHMIEEGTRDWAYRIIEGIVANHYGYSSRNDWTQELKALN